MSRKNRRAITAVPFHYLVFLTFADHLGVLLSIGFWHLREASNLHGGPKGARIIGKSVWISANIAFLLIGDGETGSTAMGRSIALSVALIVPTFVCPWLMTALFAALSRPSRRHRKRKNLTRSAKSR